MPMRRFSICRTSLLYGLTVFLSLTAASLALAADCQDGDGDGAVQCSGGCDPKGKPCDCDDGDGSRSPTFAELCNGIDDDCDTEVDEDFTFFGYVPGPSGPAPADLVIGDDCIEGIGICEALGTVVCSADQLSAECSAVPEAPQTEGPQGDPTCFDLVDNDCDGWIDHQDEDDCKTAEICNGFDDDNDGVVDDGFNLDVPCTVGVGLCENSGVTVCGPGGDVACSVSPFQKGVEGPPGSRSCRDGLDNDCDGFADLFDTNDCVGEAELCDGKDNDGDGLVDEDFPLGETCGPLTQGGCSQPGVYVCGADKSGVACNPTETWGFPEGPVGTCDDGEDNDCDGLFDLDDPGCGAAIPVTCALPYYHPPGSKNEKSKGNNGRGKPGKDCNAWHEIVFEAPGASPDQVTAELLALDLDGNIVASTPVDNGDVTHMASRIQRKDFMLQTKHISGDTVHKIFAPIPLLRVTVDDPKGKTYAYCSNIPYLDVVEPSGTVVSLSDRDLIQVVAAIPHVDPSTLAIKVDGVEIFQAMGIAPESCTSSPCNSLGPIGSGFEVSELIIQTADSVEVPSANTITMNLSNLGCGGHVVVIDGDRQIGSFPTPASAACHEDDLRDKGFSSGFGIEITSPEPDSVVATLPVFVEGEACHGKPIAGVKLNGLAIGVTNDFFPGDGEDSADTYVVPIDELVPLTDLRKELDTGVGTPGTFDPGANRLIAQASDHELNTTFDTFFFAVGAVKEIPTVFAADLEPPAPLNLSASAADLEPLDIITLNEDITTHVEKAFTLTLTDEALNTFFSAQCDSVADDIAAKVEDALKNYVHVKKINALCDPWVYTAMTSVSVDPAGFSCTATPSENQVDVKIELPTVVMNAHSWGYCKDEFLGVCTQSLKVDIDTLLHISGMNIQFTVTEDSILNEVPVTPFFNPGVLSRQTYSNKSDVGCIVGFFLDVLNILAEIFTFGAFDPGPVAEAPLISTDLSAKLGLIQGDPFTLELVKFDNEELPDFSLQLSHELADVQITPLGMSAAVRASFTPTVIDPEVADVPGTPVTDAPLPLPDIPGAGGATIAISDDVFNQLFAGMTKAGKLKTLFEDVRPLAGFFPEDCSTLPTPAGEGVCYAITTDLPCTDFPAGSAQRTSCALTRLLLGAKNINGDTPIILHGRVDVPPKLLIDDEPSTTNEVEVALRMSQVSVSMIADRDEDGVYTGTLEAVHGCFEQGAPTDDACALWEACLNLNVFGDLSLGAQDGKPKIAVDVNSLTSDLSSGALCGGSVDPDSAEGAAIGEAAESQTIEIIRESTGDSTPDLVSEGLTFGGLVQFVDAILIAIENDGNLDFDDYIAITGDLVK